MDKALYQKTEIVREDKKNDQLVCYPQGTHFREKTQIV